MNMRLWLEALAEPNRTAAQVLTTNPINVRTLGLIRERASQRTMVSRRTPQARPKAEVQETLIGRTSWKKSSSETHEPQGTARCTEENLSSIPPRSVVRFVVHVTCDFTPALLWDFRSRRRGWCLSSGLPIRAYRWAIPPRLHHPLFCSTGRGR